jgi:hypothetical protein
MAPVAIFVHTAHPLLISVPRSKDAIANVSLEMVTAMMAVYPLLLLNSKDQVCFIDLQAVRLFFLSSPLFLLLLFQTNTLKKEFV